MFPEGSKYPDRAEARQAIAALAPILQKLASPVHHLRPHRRRRDLCQSALWFLGAVRGPRQYRARSSWASSASADDRISSVVGRSTAEPFFPNDPYHGGQ
jgi:chemotaxis protein MotB